jgi:Glycosyl transferases group 1
VAKAFYILDHPLLPTPYNSRFFVEKFARGFSYRGYEVVVVKRLEDLCNPGFVMISDHDYSYSLPTDGPLSRLLWPVKAAASSEAKVAATARMRAKRWVVKRLAARVEKADLTTIAWFWQDNATILEELGMPVIFTGEHFYGVPASAPHRAWQDFYRNRPDALPIRFSADIDPGAVGEGCGNDNFDVCFIGSRIYKPAWYGAFSGLPLTRIIPSPPYIPEEERIGIYRDSKLSLGLHSEGNIANHVVVERVFESLAHGAVCVTDNPTAVEVTGGVAVGAKTLDDMRSLVGSLLADDDRRADLRRRGFELIRRDGTYAHRADEFIALGARLAA